jgi:hypothetical protein
MAKFDKYAAINFRVIKMANEGFRKEFGYSPTPNDVLGRVLSREDVIKNAYLSAGLSEPEFAEGWNNLIGRLQAAASVASKGGDQIGRNVQREKGKAYIRSAVRRRLDMRG